MSPAGESFVDVSAAVASLPVSPDVASAPAAGPPDDPEHANGAAAASPSVGTTTRAARRTTPLSRPLARDERQGRWIGVVAHPLVAQWQLLHPPYVIVAAMLFVFCALRAPTCAGAANAVPNVWKLPFTSE